MLRKDVYGDWNKIFKQNFVESGENSGTEDKMLKWQENQVINPPFVLHL